MTKLDQFLDVKNKEEREPALKVGAATGTVAGILFLVTSLFPHLMSDRTTTIILVVSAFLLPIITAIFTRGRVWSAASVEELIEDAVQDALRVYKSPKD